MSTTTTARPMPRLKQQYRDEIAAALKTQLGLDNVMQIPRFDKVVLNVGLGEAINDSKALDGAMADLAAITGQKPRINRARKSIAAFKLREGMPIGIKVTLRGDRMWEFLDRLITVALPRTRDFRGMNPRSFDGHGNYTFADRAARVPRGRLRHGGRGARDGHHHRDHHRPRRSCPRAARRVRVPLRA